MVVTAAVVGAAVVAGAVVTAAVETAAVVGGLVLVADTWGATKQMVIAARDLISN